MPFGCNIQHDDQSKQYCIAYLKVAKRVDLKSSITRKNYVTMYGEGCQLDL